MLDSIFIKILRLFSLLIFILICLSLFISCEKNKSILSPENDTTFLPIDVNPVNIQLFDIYSGDGKIKLYWITGRPHCDPWTPPPPDVETVRIYMSENNPDENFIQIYESNKDGEDSTLVENLINGKEYYFRLATYTKDDSLMGVSRPRMAIPGIQNTLFISQEINQAESPLYISNLSWAPDGQSLAVIKADASYKPNIHILNLNNLNNRQITNFTSDNYRLMSVAWSPNGQFLAYSYTASSTFYKIDYRIWLVNINTLEQKDVTSGRVDSDPTWFTDNKIIFCKGTYDPPNIPELYYIDLLQSNNEVQITNDQSIRKYTPNAFYEMDLIVYSGEKVNSAGRYLYLISSSGNYHKPLTENRYWQDIHPSWSPNGQKVYFTSNRNGHYEIWSIDVNTQKLSQITHGLSRSLNRFYGRVNPKNNYIALLESDSNNNYYLKILYFD